MLKLSEKKYICLFKYYIRINTFIVFIVNLAFAQVTKCDGVWTNSKCNSLEERLLPSEEKSGRFSFDIFGGSDTLDDLDFIDVNLYLDKRNFKNVYKNINFKYIKKNDYILYFFSDDNILNYRNISLISKFDNLDVYNIEFNPMLKDEVNAAKRIKYLGIIRDNIQNIDEKNI